GLDAGERLGPARVDRDDPRVGMRAAQHAADELAGQVEVGAEAGAAGDLVRAVGSDRARADERLADFGIRRERRGHGQLLLISTAASITALMILSYPVQRHRLPASQ